MRISGCRVERYFNEGVASHGHMTERDWIALLQERLPLFSIDRVEAAGHFVFEEKPEAVVATGERGLAGVTVSCRGDFSLSLDRSRGGLRARERSDGAERTWQVLGASRGEGGILGEGVRQALLRIQTRTSEARGRRSALWAVR